MKMNKTIIAVLAVFLVLAAFVGATSAAQVIYPYTEVKDLAGGKAIYLLEDPTKVIIANASGFIMTSDFTKGIYKLVSASSGDENKEYYLTNPDATIKIYLTGTTSSVVGKTVSTSSGLDFVVIPARDSETGANFSTNASSLWFTTPDGGKTSFFGLANSSIGVIANTELGYWNGANLDNYTVPSIEKTDATPGTWSVQFKYSEIPGADSQISKTSATAYKFTIATTTDSITANKDSITRGNSVLVTVSGTPNYVAVIDINKDGFYLVPGQSGVQYTKNYSIDSAFDTFTTLTNDSKANVAYDEKNWTNFSASKIIVNLGDSGSRTFQLNTYSTSVEDTYKLTAKFYKSIGGTYNNLTYADSKKSVNVAVKKGAVTIEASESSYYIGNEISLSGTNTETKRVFLYIKGSNKALQEIPAADSGSVTSKGSPITVNSDNTWSKKFYIDNKFDAGTYTFYAASKEFDTFKNVGDNAVYVNTDKESYTQGTYATVALTLKQPFLTATPASNVIAKGDKITITGTVEGTPETLLYYVFGTNYYTYDKVTPEDDSTYKIEVDTAKLGVATGQYFVVIQHPMYDKKFNVQPGDYDMMKSKNGLKTQIYSYATKADNSLESDYRDLISDITSRQIANAAQSVCDLIDEEYVDDIYVKLDFVVANAYITINAVADQKQGATFTVSGTTNVAVDEDVTIDVVSTKFQAEPKASVSAASYLVQTAKVVAGSNDVNTYSATFDGTPLAIDAYTAVATITRDSGDDLKVSTTFNIVSAPATPTATETGTTAPTTPTATATQTPAKTPGFGALIALAGLGAVAVLVLRRQ